MRIAVTGSSGFVGSNLIPFISENPDNEIVGVTRVVNDDNNICYSELTAEFWNSCNSFIHLAGKAHDLKGISDDSEYFEVNTELTKKLFNQFLNSDCKVFIFMSSVKAVADIVKVTLTEEIKPTPITAYGKSKLAAEEYILSQKLGKDKKVYVLRPCMIHGPGNKGNLNLLYKLIQSGIPYPLGVFKNNRSFLSVDNLCFIIEQILIQQPESGVYHLADDKAISTNELVQIIGEGVNKSAKILKLPKVFVQQLGKIGDLLHLPFNSEKLEKLTENYVVSNSKIKQTLNIELPLSAREGLLKTIKSFKTTKNNDR